MNTTKEERRRQLIKGIVTAIIALYSIAALTIIMAETVWKILRK